MVFVVGAASLGTEIAAARLLAPYFGASTIVWANTIATVLLALSIGYALGGRVADRHPSMRALATIVLVASVLLALVPYVAPPFLNGASGAFKTLSAQQFLGSLAAVLVLCAVPLVLMGAVAPFALRLAVPSVDRSGRTAGRLSATSTIGALTGTFLSALLLIPLIGTRRTFVAFALALALVAMPHLARRTGGVPARLLVGFPTLLAVGVPGLLAALLVVAPAHATTTADGRVLFETDTVYQHVRVIQTPSGERWLELNEGHAIHSLWRPHSFLTNNYWDDPLVLPLATGHGPPRRLAILGDAAGTIARAYGHFFPRTWIDAVEIDGVLTQIGRRWFGLGGPRLHTITADARPFLRQSGPSYDAIVVDAYRQPYIPFYLTTREFFTEARRRLADRGVVIVNVGHPPGSDQLEHVIAATLRAVFPHVARDQVDATNVLEVASRQPLDATDIAGSATSLPAQLRTLALTVAARLGPAPRGGQVYTDDRAPVEWLVDSTLFSYAMQGRR